VRPTQSTTTGSEGPIKEKVKDFPKNKRRRRIGIAAGGFVLGAGLVTINDDAKHAYTAVQRSARVVDTLFRNINEYANALFCLA
jgi:hypothetical protein